MILLKGLLIFFPLFGFQFLGRLNAAIPVAVLGFEFHARSEVVIGRDTQRIQAQLQDRMGVKRMLGLRLAKVFFIQERPQSVGESSGNLPGNVHLL